MKVDKTYKELRIFNGFASNYLVNNGYWDVEKKQFTTKENTKLVANLKNLKKQVEKLFEQYMEERDNLQLDNCATDEKTKVILMADSVDAKGVVTRVRQFTPEGEKKLKAAIKKLDDTKVTVNSRITDGEWELTDEEKEAFSGLIIPDVVSAEAAEETTVELKKV